MGNQLDRFLEELQAQVHEEIRASYGDRAYQRWLNPLYEGALADPDGYSLSQGHCGDTMEIFLRLEEGRVKEAAFQTSGCGSSTICGSLAAEISLGKKPEEILEVTGETILEQAGGLPREERQCAFLAAEALQRAVHDFMMKRGKKSVRVLRGHKE